MNRHSCYFMLFSTVAYFCVFDENFTETFQIEHKPLRGQPNQTRIPLRPSSYQTNILRPILIFYHCTCTSQAHILPQRMLSLFVGDTATLDLEVYVNDKTASSLNSGDDKLEDILVLHLEGGKDFFVTVLGSYTLSCFGCSLEALTHLPSPIRDTPAEQIHQLVSV